jgi:hypothetical protein
VTEQSKIIPAEKAPAPKGEGRGRPQKWNFDNMEVGDAFEIPADKLQSLRQKCSNLNRLELKARPDNPKRWSAGEAVDGKYYVWRHQ